MIFRKTTENETKSEEILKKVNKCKTEELGSLLQQIELEIEKSHGKNTDLLTAKTMITTRMVSRSSI
jgi:hypothetical protein